MGEPTEPKDSAGDLEHDYAMDLPPLAARNRSRSSARYLLAEWASDLAVMRAERDYRCHHCGAEAQGCLTAPAPCCPDCHHGGAVRHRSFAPTEEEENPT